MEGVMKMQSDRLPLDAEIVFPRSVASLMAVPDSPVCEAPAGFLFDRCVRWSALWLTAKRDADGAKHTIMLDNADMVTLAQEMAAYRFLQGWCEMRQKLARAA